MNIEDARALRAAKDQQMGWAIARRLKAKNIRAEPECR